MIRRTDIKMKCTAVIVCACLAVLVLAEEPRKIAYNGNQLWKIANDNKTTLNVLKSLEKNRYLTLWGLNSTKVDAMINANCLDKVKKKLRESNLKYEVMIEDVQKVIDEENLKPEQNYDPHKGGEFTWTYYYSLDDIYTYLNHLAQNYPELCTLRTIGSSVEGRPIQLLRITNGGKSNKAIFVEGGIHAREWISPAASIYIIHQFIHDYKNAPSSIENIDWYFVPVLNPDGYEYSYNVDRLWRKNRSRSSTKNCTGVDLNRNWSYDWGGNGSSDHPCSNSYKGKKPFSEPETEAIANFFNNNADIRWVGYVSIHSYGQFILYPWGTQYAQLEDHEEIHRTGKEAAEKILSIGGVPYTVGPIASTIYKAAGSSIDWARGAKTIKYSYTIELRDDGRYGFILPSKFIKITSEDALILIKTVAKAAASNIDEGTLI